MTQGYYTDLTPSQWEFLERLIPAPKPGGRPRTTDRVAVVSAIFYVICTGCQRRLVPHDFPAWSTVYTYFNNWRKEGTWANINEHLRMQVRVCEDRHPSPSAAICAAQWVKVGNPRCGSCGSVGFDGGKLIKGWNRPILVDPMGLLLRVIVTAANGSEQRGAKVLFWKTKRLGANVSRLVRVWADSDYQGQDFMQKVMNQFRWILEVIKCSDNLAGFVVVPKRWIVERTFGWLNWNRRLSKNYEMLTTTGEAFCYVAMIRIMLRPLEKAS